MCYKKCILKIPFQKFYYESPIKNHVPKFQKKILEDFQNKNKLEVSFNDYFKNYAGVARNYEGAERKTF